MNVLMRGMVVAGASTCLVAACGSKDREGLRTVNRPVQAASPSAFVQVLDLAGADAPSLRGVYGTADGFWSVLVGANGTTAILSKPDGVQVARIDRVPVARASGRSLPAVSTPDGALWIASGSALIRVDPTTAATESFALPDQPTNAATDVWLPPQLKGTQAPIGLAVDRTNNTLLIAISNAKSLVRFDTKLRTASLIALPADLDDAESVAVLADGSIGVSLHDYAKQTLGSLGILSPSSKTWSVVTMPAALFVLPGGGSFITGGNSFMSVSADGSTVRAIADTSFLIPPEPQAGPDGELLAITRDGILVADLQGETQRIAAPFVDCDLGQLGVIEGVSPPTTSEHGTKCMLAFSSVATDDSGRIYAATNSGLVFAASPQ